jgi:flagellar export protein FliJ
VPERLALVLRLRKRAEDVRAKALAVAATARARETRRLEALRDRMQAGRRALVAAGLHGAPGGHLLLAALLAEQARLVAHAQVGREQAARAEERTAQAAVVTAAQQRRAVERVLEMRRAEVQRARETHEQRRLDDVASTRAARRRLTGGARR